jgi:hypothetical protein
VAKSQLKEHQLQYLIHYVLTKCNILHFETDVMDALKYFGNNQTARFAFINHHKKMGYCVGQPDMVVCRGGKVYFVELKTRTGRQSDEQKKFQAKAEAMGIPYLIWRNLEDCEKWLKN